MPRQEARLGAPEKASEPVEQVGAEHQDTDDE